MSDTRTPTAPTTVLGRVRAWRAARTEQTVLERDLGALRTEADMHDLEAILLRHDDETAEPIRDLLFRLHAA